MNAPTPFRSDTISDIKVTQHAKPFAVRVAWIDSAGASRTATRFGPCALQLDQDLQAAAIMGDETRRCFLVGWIRGLIDNKGLDDGLRPPTW
jgi:hypothetical protein